MKVSLVVLAEGKAKGQAIPIKIPQFIIGRDPQCNLRPASVMISKRHCAVIIRDDAVFIRDFESTNGTMVNEQPVSGEMALTHNDILKVGPLAFQVTIEGLPSVTQKTPVPADKTKKPEPADIDDAAALLLGFDDDTSDSPSTSEVPSGSTVFDMPAHVLGAGAPGEDPAAGTGSGETAKPDAAKKPEAKKSSAENASQAAAALWDKLRRGQRR